MWGEAPRGKRSTPPVRAGRTRYGISSIFAQAFHRFQLASNSALASSIVATWFEVRISPGLLGACSAQNQRRDSGPVRV